MRRVHHGAFGRLSDLPDSQVPPWWWERILLVSLVSCVWGSPAQGLPRVSPQNCLATPISSSRLLWSAFTCLYIHHNENGMELPRETIWHPLGYPRLSVLDSEHHPSQNRDHLSSSPPSPRNGEEDEGWGVGFEWWPWCQRTSYSNSCQCWRLVHSVV